MTTTGKKVPVTIHTNPDSNIWVVWSHGNCTTIEDINYTLKHIANKAAVNIIAYEYDGYSDVQPNKTTRTNTIENLILTINYLARERHIPYKNIILVGRSIGTGPTCAVAKKLTTLNIAIKGVVLISPFSTTLSIISNKLSWLVPFMEAFKNSKELEGSKQKLVIVSARDDEIIPHMHSKELESIARDNNCFIQSFYLRYGGHNNLHTDLFVKAINAIKNS